MAQPEPESSLKDLLAGVLGAVKRGRWLVIATFTLTALGTIGVLSRIPDRYSSDATLVVVQQQIPERYVTPTMTTSLTETLQSIRQEVLSRTRLLSIVNEFGLYGSQHKSLGPEGEVALIRKNIKVEPIESQDPARHDLSAFRLSFVTEDPRLAQAVTSRLTTLFIQENLTVRERQATITTNFLKQRQEAARAKLAAHEERLRDFKMKYLGQLPEQQQGNLAILGGQEAQLQNTTASLDRARQHRVYLESLVRAYRSMQPPPRAGSTLPVPAAGTPSAIQAVRTQLVQLQAERQEALSRYTPQHPDVIALNHKIAQTEALLKAARTAKETAEPASPPASSQTAELNVSEEVDTATAQLKSEIEANRIEIDNLSSDQKRLEASIAEYQNRLNLTPVREQQLAEILRDEEILKRDYTDLLSKEMQSQLAGSLEKEQAGQQFRLVDQPSLPTVPISPKRVPIYAGGALGGIVLGVALAYLMDLRKRVVYTEDALAQRIKTPLMVGIPLIRTSRERRLNAWLTGIEWVSSSAIVLSVLSVVVYHIVKAAPWLARGSY